MGLCINHSFLSSFIEIRCDYLEMTVNKIRVNQDIYALKVLLLIRIAKSPLLQTESAPFPIKYGRN